MKKLILATMFAVTAVQAAPFGQPGTWNVFGFDNRVALTSNEYPWRTIGKVNGCTGTLVGPDLVLTAAHCIFEKKVLKHVYPFYANYVDGYSRHSSEVTRMWWGTDDPDNDRGKDWALLRLEKRLGDTMGWMGTESATPNYVTLAGYSSDFRYGDTAGVHQNCQFRSTWGSMWLHDCDGTRGSSGGPIFHMKGNEPYIVALQVAEYRDGGEDSLFVPSYTSGKANIAVPASTFSAKIRDLK